ncbi:serine phosphatase RsbU (regulator of sigma subunit) [Catenuloplanes nepalensis]|uniref:Serine phosphatase RsbU (Regulator of sigma subunit) n=1 Tax=Catenuloplanes nepalensis TaxID=587533 RepID=A0ABT9N695_9ACTN|nr:PP2C family protein-serine/threonine phosphatase [Catenuloplanes nepalensis]MDP9798771.1 serine phosphatase RsbU (regulator of sigma subunit) [Catenuloplanes nepalensis]
MGEGDRAWSAALHRLWRTVGAITDREELAELVLPPLQALPGVVAVWGLRHRVSDGKIAEYRWTGVPLESDEDRALARRMALWRDGDAVVVREQVHSAECVIVAGFEVAGEAAGTIELLVDGAADEEQLTTCLWQVIDVTREAISRLRRRRSDDEQQIRDALLAEASLQMDAVLDPGQTMHRVARMTVPAIAEGCLVYSRDNRELVLRSAVHMDMRRMAALLADDATADELRVLAERAVAEQAERIEPADAEKVGARLLHAQVMRARDQVLGVLLFFFDRDQSRVPHTSFLRDLAQRAALAVNNSELYESRRREVVTLQEHLLPGRLPEVQGMRVAAAYAVGDRALDVGGDFYDLVVRSNGVVAALIGDVCGRGAAAAALTGMSRHTLGTLLQERVSPARALSRLNAGLRRDGSWRFVTAGVALLRETRAGLSVQWMSAGHPAPLILRQDGRVLPGRGGGLALGITDEARIGRSRLTLAPGDTLLMFTDGLTESRDHTGRMFEDVALYDTVRRLRDLPVDELVRELSQAAKDFGTTGADDIAVLAIRAEQRCTRT